MRSIPTSFIDVFSSPSTSPVSTPGRDVPRRVKDDELRWHHDYFARLESMSREAVRNGHLLDWSDRNADEPRPWFWPLQDDGSPFPPSQLSKAFSHYEIPQPSCACATQEWDPSKDHTFKIWVVSSEDSQYRGTVACGCRIRKQGCNIWVSLHELYKQPGLLTRTYPQRSPLGPGIYAFNQYDTPIVEVHHNASPAKPWVQSPRHVPSPSYAPVRSERDSVAPVSPYTPPKRRSGFKGRGSKTPSPPHRLSPRALEKKTASRNLKMHTPTPSTTAPTLVNEGNSLDVVQNDEESESDDQRILETLKLIYASSNESSPAATPGPTTAASSSKAPPAYNPNANMGRPGDRLALDMDYLEPTLPEPLLLFIRNRHIAPYTGESLDNAFKWLESEEGLSGKDFWRTFDQCNCGNYFTKDALARLHGPRCLCWPYTDSDKMENEAPYLAPPPTSVPLDNEGAVNRVTSGSFVYDSYAQSK